MADKTPPTDTPKHPLTLPPEPRRIGKDAPVEADSRRKHNKSQEPSPMAAEFICAGNPDLVLRRRAYKQGRAPFGKIGYGARIGT